ncbi:MAG TPA: cyclopropane fatty acyl phospholipid synthase [Xanthomonadales bacterium]|nr:cyclopropane fatty acyl phospholipid synthase [Xanthomonadales bacterium]
MNKAEKELRKLFKIAGINVNGKNPWDIKVHNKRFFKRTLTDGPLGFGESYMDGDWDSEQLDETVARIQRAALGDKIKKNLPLILFLAKSKFIDVATIKKSYVVGRVHYGVGNELYERMLDRDMNYTCGYWKGLGDINTAWKNPKNLDKAEAAKLDLICRKLHLKPGMKVFDVGCGFGNFARFAAANYKVKVVGITITKEQAELARIRCKGLPVDIRLEDYREMKPEKFDRIVAIGMVEHVTHKHYEKFMQIMDSFLKPDGLFMIHTIGSPVSTTHADPWTEKYLFPNSHLASIAQIAKAAENKFLIEDLQNFGAYYYPTLMSWDRNFDKSWKELKRLYPEKYDDRFYRMWKLYLLGSAGGFKARLMQLWQIVLSKSNTLEVYQSVR